MGIPCERCCSRSKWRQIAGPRQRADSAVAHQLSAARASLRASLHPPGLRARSVVPSARDRREALLHSLQVSAAVIAYSGDHSYSPGPCHRARVSSEALSPAWSAATEIAHLFQAATGLSSPAVEPAVPSSTPTLNSRELRYWAHARAALIDLLHLRSAACCCSYRTFLADLLQHAAPAGPFHPASLLNPLRRLLSAQRRDPRARSLDSPFPAAAPRCTTSATAANLPLCLTHIKPSLAPHLPAQPTFPKTQSSRPTSSAPQRRFRETLYAPTNRWQTQAPLFRHSRRRCLTGPSTPSFWKEVHGSLKFFLSALVREHPAGPAPLSDAVLAATSSTSRNH